MGREHGRRPVLTWSWAAGSLLGSSASAATGSDSRALQAAGLRPAPDGLICLALHGGGAGRCFWSLLSSRTPAMGGKVAGSGGAADALWPQEGKLLPTATLVAPPAGFFSWAAFLLAAALGGTPAAPA